MSMYTMFSSMANSMSWLSGATKPSDSDTETEPLKLGVEEKAKPEGDAGDTQGQQGEGETKASTDVDEASVSDGQNQDSAMADIEEMSSKAISTAKEWGSYLFNVGKAATVTVASTAANTAKQIKDTVEEKTILGDFHKEQEKFVIEKQEQKKLSEAAVPPWVGYNEEQQMKQQIMALSQDKRNFLRNPPAGVQFQFDFTASSPVATATLQEDPNLKKMRFELVPKQITEEAFWRNYFYRVSLIKQSAQLSSLAQQSGVPGEESPAERSRTPDPLNRDKSTPIDTTRPGQVKGDDPMVPSSPPEHEFVSDTFQDSGQISAEDLQQLGVTGGDQKEPTTDADRDIPEWERELAAELQEYEVVDDGQDLDDADLEKEILQQIEAETNGTGHAH